MSFALIFMKVLSTVVGKNQLPSTFESLVWLTQQRARSNRGWEPEHS